MAFKSLQFFLLLFSIAPHLIFGHNLEFPQHLQGRRKGDIIEGIHDVKTYLRRYGYLNNKKTNSHTDENDNVFDDGLESAIKTYQKTFNLSITGVLDKATLAQFSKPRCAVPDFFNHKEANVHMGSRYAFFPGNLKWPSTKFHLTYKFIHDYPLNLVAPVIRALATWASNSPFTFSEALEGQVADINISFERGEHGDGSPFDGRGGILAHAFAPTDGRLHFDADETWTAGVVLNEFDVETVALHELGHVLGLGHSTVQRAIMWPFIDPGATKGLSEDDVAGIRALYG